MSHQDKNRCAVRYHADQLQLALRWLLGGAPWGGLRFRNDCTWLPIRLAATALIWAWSDEPTLGDRFLAARRIAEFLYRPQRQFAGSIQAFLKLLVRWTGTLAALLQAAFRLRVGSHVRLLRKLGYARESRGTVYLWPEHAAKRRRPPLELRLIVAVGGRCPVYLVTSAPRGGLTDAQVIEVYRRRWGIELYFRHLKQTFQRRKLRSTSAAHARVELEWSLLGLWGMALYAQVELEKQEIDPVHMSVSRVLYAFCRILRDYRHPIERRGCLNALIGCALRDTYQRRNKTSRDYPRKKRPDPPAGPPKILNATAAQIELAKELRPIASRRLRRRVARYATDRREIFKRNVLTAVFFFGYDHGNWSTCVGRSNDSRR